MLPGPVQIAARTCLLLQMDRLLAYQLSDNFVPNQVTE
jgi:hypothetical protein